MRPVVLIPAWIALLLLACGREPAQTAPGVAERREAPAVSTAREVKPSPAVVALLRPDPDLEGTVSPEEVKAALAAAKATRRPAASSPRPERPAEATPVAGSERSEWSELERQKREKEKERESWLASTTVYLAGNDSFWYHGSGCEELYRYFFDRERVLHRVYIGRPVTLKHAADSRITPHPACGAPAYDF